MKTAEIKRRYLAHFEANGHTVVPSAPLPAISDPNLLFVNAGMVQFVPYFLGQQTPPYQRAVSVQKCIRTPDIDEVGKTTRHGTFFQMNGNFSFGDYFKAGRFKSPWDMGTKSQRCGSVGPSGSGPVPSTTTRRTTSAVGVCGGADRASGQAKTYGPWGPRRAVRDRSCSKTGARSTGVRAARRSTRKATGVLESSHAVERSGTTKATTDIGDLPAKNSTPGGLERMARPKGVENLRDRRGRPIWTGGRETASGTARFHTGGARVAPEDGRLRW